ncbi:MAG: GAF domain-containing protein [Cyclobacteriaceae bacterium]|nr:GAF domain-containing protein [Cyclobacteriaceae bacterium]MCH8516358.1 GAF domain-containing protein [Cyclobacteriaceae bacterium]
MIQRVNPNSLRASLIYSFMVFAILIGVGSFAIFQLTQSIDSGYQKVHKSYDHLIRELNTLENRVNKHNNFLLSQSTLDLVSGESAQMSEKNRIMKQLDYLKQQESFFASQYQLDFGGLITQSRILVGMWDDFPSGNAAQRYYQEDYLPVFNDFLGYLRVLNTGVVKARDRQLERLTNLSQLMTLLVIALGIASLGTAFGLYKYITRKLMNSLRTVKEELESLASGQLLSREVSKKDEVTELMTQVSQLNENLKHLKSFALEVGNGNFDTKISVFSNQGEIGSALAQMRTSLQQVSENDRIEKWKNEGYSQVSDILRTQADSLERLTDRILAFLSDFIKANQGNLFVYHSSDDEEGYLTLASAVAFEKKKFLSGKVALGQGLVGQVFVERQLMVFHNLPTNYITIGSGFGEAKPTALLLCPMIYDEKCYGVLEFASFKVFEKYQVDFIENIAESVASTLAKVSDNERTKHLLEESNMLTQQMQAQEEEMRQNMEEMQATQEEMERSTREFEALNIAVKEARLCLELNLTGEILAVNPPTAKFCNTSEEFMLDTAISDWSIDIDWHRLINHLQDNPYLDLDCYLLEEKKEKKKIRAFFYPVKGNNFKIHQVVMIATAIDKEDQEIQELRPQAAAYQAAIQLVATDQEKTLDLLKQQKEKLIKSLNPKL